jgi:hypothetical protein
MRVAINQHRILIYEYYTNITNIFLQPHKTSYNFIKHHLTLKLISAICEFKSVVRTISPIESALIARATLVVKY